MAMDPLKNGVKNGSIGRSAANGWFREDSNFMDCDHHQYGGSINGGSPKWLVYTVYNGKSANTMDDLGVPPF